MKDEKNKIIDEKEETVKIEQSVDGNEELENKMKDKTDLQSKNHLYLKKDNTDDTLLLPLF